MNRPPKGDEYRRGNFAGMMFQPSANDTPNMTIKIKPGSFWVNNEKFVEYDGGVSPRIEAPSSGAKWVLVALNKSGKCVLVNGIPRPNNPEPPKVTQNMLPLAFVYVKSSTTIITNDMVYDARPEYSAGGYPINHIDLQNRNKENAHSIEAITNLRDELNNRPTFDDTKDLIKNKAEYNGTHSASFVLNNDDSGVPVEHCGIYVNRGSLPKVGIKFNEDIDQWQYTNDGNTWLSWDGNANISSASDSEQGIVKLSAEPDNESEPVAVGINDPKYLSIDDKVSKSDLQEYITKDEFVNKLSEKMDIEGTYSKDDINNIFVTKSYLDNVGLDTYTKGQIDSFLQVKANASQTYTKNEIQDELSNYYKKEEIDDLISHSGGGSGSGDFDSSKYYVKNEVDLLLQNVMTNTYNRNTLDSKFDAKANSLDVHNELDKKADKDDVYTKEVSDIKLQQLDTSHKNLFYERSTVDTLLSQKALATHNHSSGDIIEDAAHRFVSDNQINKWDAKQDKIDYVPEDSNNKGIANGYAPLDENGQIPIQYIPNDAKDEVAIVDTYYELYHIPDANLKDGKHYAVLDSTGDPDGLTGKNEYVYHNGKFVSLTIKSNLTTVDWSNITNVPEDLTHSDLVNYYKKSEVDNLLNNKADTSNVYSQDEINNLLNNKANSDSVYTKSEIDDKIPDAYSKTESDVLLNTKANTSDVYTKTQVDDLVNSKIDSDDTYTKSEIDSAISNAVNTKAESNDVYTKTEIDDKLNNISSNNGYSKEEIDGLLDNKANTSDVYTKSETDNLVLSSVVDISGKADKSDVYTKDEVDNVVNAKANSNDVYTKTQVDNALTGKANIDDVYSKSEVDATLVDKANTSDVYTKDEIDDVVNTKANSNDVYTKTEIDDKLSNISSDTGYTNDEIDNLLNNKVDNSDIYTKDEIDDKFNSIPIDTGYTNDEIDSLLNNKADNSNVYTKTEIDDKFNNIPTGYTNDEIDNLLNGKVDTSDVYTKTEVDNALNQKIDAISVYTKSEVDAKLVDIATGGTVDISGKADADKVYTKSETDEKLSLKANTNDVYTKTEVDNQLNSKANADSIYSKDDVDNKLSSKANASDVYTKNEIDNTMASKADADNVYDKETIDNKLQNYYNKSEIDAKLSDISVDAYTKSQTDTKITEAINNIDLSSKANVSDVYTKEEVNNAIKDFSSSSTWHFETNYNYFSVKDITVSNVGNKYTINVPEKAMLENVSFELTDLGEKQSFNETAEMYTIIIDFDAEQNFTPTETFVYNNNKLPVLPTLPRVEMISIENNVFKSLDNVFPELVDYHTLKFNIISTLKTDMNTLVVKLIF